MAELIDVTKALLGKGDWARITDEDKDKNFFIINRLLSKKYPEKSQLLNIKIIDKVLALNLWHEFMLNEPYPNWFWSKSENKSSYDISEKDFNLLKLKLRIDKEDLEYLLDKHPDVIKEELKHFKDIEKKNK